MEEHYEAHIHEVLSELEERTNQADWRQAFEVASNWARKNFRERLNEEVLEKVEALYVVQMNTEAQTHTDRLIDKQRRWYNGQQDRRGSLWTHRPHR